MADHFSMISSRGNYRPEILNVKNRSEGLHFNFVSVDNEPYNYPISIMDIKQALNGCGNAADGPDRI